MADLARRSGLTRTSIYQYFSSVADVFAELVINDMADLVNNIEAEVGQYSQPLEQVRCWIESSMAHLASGDHAIIRRLSEGTLPQEKRGVIKALHGQFMLALLSPVKALGIADIEATAYFIAATVNAAANRVDSGCDMDAETRLATTYVMSALSGMTRGQAH